MGAYCVKIGDIVSLSRLVDRLLGLLGCCFGFLLGLLLWLRLGSLHRSLLRLLFWNLLELLLLWDYLVTLVSQLLQAGIVIVGRLDGLHLQGADSGTNAVGALSLNDGRVGGKLRLGLVGQRVGLIQKFEVLVELQCKL